MKKKIGTHLTISNVSIALRLVGVGIVNILCLVLRVLVVVGVFGVFGVVG